MVLLVVPALVLLTAALAGAGVRLGIEHRETLIAAADPGYAAPLEKLLKTRSGLFGAVMGGTSTLLIVFAFRIGSVAGFRLTRRVGRRLLGCWCGSARPFGRISHEFDPYEMED